MKNAEIKVSPPGESQTDVHSRPLNAKSEPIGAVSMAVNDVQVSPLKSSGFPTKFIASLAQTKESTES